MSLIWCTTGVVSVEELIDSEAWHRRAAAFAANTVFFAGATVPLVRSLLIGQVADFKKGNI